MVRKEDIYYDSRDNKTKLHALEWVPCKGEIKGILQIVHGLAERMEKYDEFAEFMAERGYVVVGNDHLGHGESVSDDQERGYFCKKDGATVLVRDVHRLKKMIQNAYPGRAYMLLGNGMGAMLMERYVMDYGKGIDGAILMGCCAKSVSHFSKENMEVKILSKLHGDNYKSEKINEWVFGSCQKEESKDLLSLNVYKTMVELADYIQTIENEQKIRKDLPILFVSGACDPVGENCAGVKKIYQKYLDTGCTEVEMKLYPEKGQDILQETGREQVYEELLEWIETKIK